MSNFSLNLPLSLQENYEAAMLRDIGNWNFLSGPVILNIGAGNKLIKGTIPLSLDQGWSAPLLSDFANESVDGIITYHFLEFLTREQFMLQLREFQRVLRTEGLVNIAVPYFASEQAFHDINNQLYFTEKTFVHVLEKKYYSMNLVNGLEEEKWRLRINNSCIMGHSHMNLMLMIQLEKTP